MRRRTLAILVPTAAVALALTLDACSGDEATPAPGAGSDNDSGGGGGDAGGGGSDGGAGTDTGTNPDLDAGTDAGGDAGEQWLGPDGGISSKMTFFVTSRGKGAGGDFRDNNGQADGLAGADAFCKSLANAVSPILGAKNWRAYLSTNAVTARSRIGNGPWHNSKGVLIASDAANLHDEGAMNLLSLTTNLDEWGNQVRAQNPGNVHDILTGTMANGSASPNTCANWTSSAQNQQGQVGHSNRAGGGQAPTSWNAAHATQGCAEQGGNSVRSGGGRGSIYCFVGP